MTGVQTCALPICLSWAGEGAARTASDPRLDQRIALAPVLPPQPQGQALPLKQLSASAYEDMRTCPYRFFALRQLGLSSVDELEAEVDKRDFGVWLHAVLAAFHAELQAAPTEDVAQRSALLQSAADAVTASMDLPDGEFLPFAAAWPAVRDGYLVWLRKHEGQG